MQLAPLPQDEPGRLDALRRYNILDTLQEQAYDDLTSIAAQVTKTPIALISLVDEERLWFKSKVGLAASQMPREYTFCSHAIVSPAVRTRLPFVVKDAHEDQRFVDNRAVVEAPHIRFYAAAPLMTPDGYALGTLCTIDRVPRELNGDQLSMLAALSRQVVTQLELRRAAEELARVAREREQYASELEIHQRQLQHMNAALQRESRTDRLTQLGNRAAFDDHLSLEHYRAARYGSALSLLMIDVDHFKHYNDRFGHLAGDRALQLVADALRGSVRESDLVIRYGGEEFSVIAPNTGKEGALVLAERIRQAVLAADFPHREVTVSVGVATIEPPAAGSTVGLLAAADKALYAAKESGRNRTCVAEMPAAG